jgi:hypothetical protein
VGAALYGWRHEAARCPGPSAGAINGDAGDRLPHIRGELCDRTGDEIALVAVEMLPFRDYHPPRPARILRSPGSPVLATFGGSVRRLVHLLRSAAEGQLARERREVHFISKVGSAREEF